MEPISQQPLDLLALELAHLPELPEDETIMVEVVDLSVEQIEWLERHGRVRFRQEYE